MDALPNYAQFPCNVSRSALIQKLMLFCSASPLSGETKSSCVTKRVKYHDTLCQLIQETNTDDEVYQDEQGDLNTPFPGMLLRIKKIYDEYPEKDFKQICQDLQTKEPNFFRLFLNCNRTNRILSNTADWIVISQRDRDTEQFGYDRAGFSKKHQRFFWGWNSNNISDDAFDTGFFDADAFNEITIGIDDDYNICMYFPSKNYDNLPYTEDHKIPYIGASYVEIQRVCENLRGMGVNLSHTPTLSAYYADEIRRVIHSL